MDRKIKTGRLYRSFDLNREEIDVEKRTVPVAFSSETPIERWFGSEILDHSQGSVQLNRLKNGAPFLMGHDPGDQVGVVESARIDSDRKGRAMIRFSKSVRGEEMLQDVVDGIRRKISVGYRIHDMTESVKDGVSTFRANSWEPLEISLVSTPADDQVGIGRAEENDNYEINIKGERKMENEIKDPKKDVIDLDAVRAEARDKAISSEQKRVSEILALGKLHRCDPLASKAITENRSVGEFQATILTEVLKAKPVDTGANIGMGEREKKDFSFSRAVLAMASNDWRLAPFEKEVSDAVGEKLKRSPQGFFVPEDVLTHKRDLTKGTAADGGNTVATDLLADSFIDLLRNRMLVRTMGATIMGGLVGDIAIPSQTGGAAAFWVAESGAPTESQATFGQPTMTPKTVGAFSDYSRKLLLQTSIDIEAFVRTDLATALALAIDLAAVNGSGASNQPTGILNTTGIGDVPGGTNGAAPTWANIVALWKSVAASNAAFGSLGFLTTTNAAAKLMTTEKASGTAQFIWSGFPGADGLSNLAGFRAGVSEQVPSNLSKGTGSNLSAIIFGNFSDLVIGEWGALDVLVDPFTGGTSGTTRVRVLQDIDILVRHAASFAAMKDAITT